VVLLKQKVNAQHITTTTRSDEERAIFQNLKNILQILLPDNHHATKMSLNALLRLYDDLIPSKFFRKLSRFCSLHLSSNGVDLHLKGKRDFVFDKIRGIVLLALFALGRE
jgi:chorismate mutase